MQNPYKPSLTPPVNRCDNLLPRRLAESTSRIVYRFGLFELTAWIGVAFWTDHLFLDLFALFIATNGARIRSTSCRTFPWTAAMCGVYPAMFLFNITRVDLFDLANWIPQRGSPVLGLQLICAAWASLAIAALLNCYRHQNSPTSSDAQRDIPEYQ